MEGKMKINEEVTVGGQPTEDELSRIKQEGFKSVINLRHDSEEGLPMSTDEEGKKVKSLNMEYVNIPVLMESAGPELVDRFRKELQEISKPVFVHCAGGKRAGAFSMMDHAVKQGMSGEDTLKKAEEMGFECDNEKLINFVKQYVDSNKT